MKGTDRCSGNFHLLVGDLICSTGTFSNVRLTVVFAIYLCVWGPSSKFGQTSGNSRSIHAKGKLRGDGKLLAANSKMIVISIQNHIVHARRFSSTLVMFSCVAFLFRGSILFPD
jgi:hypothetical protein